MENNLSVSQILNVKLPSDPAIKFLGFYPGKMEIYGHIKACIWVGVQDTISHSNVHQFVNA